MDKVFIHESAIKRRKDFEYERVDALTPPIWDSKRDSGTGEITDFTNVLLRLESTNHCNFACTFCPHPTMERPKGFMNETLISSLLSEAGSLGFKMLDLRNFGEPLMDRRLSNFAAAARDVGFSKIYIHTNGHPLRKKNLEEWGESGITDVNLSLSPKREFAATRPGVNVDKFFANIETLMSSSPDHAGILSADYIRSGFSTQSEEEEFFSWLEDVGIKIRTEIELHNWAVGEEKTHYKCHRLWSSVTVLWDGRVSLCCLDYEGDYILGDTNQSSLTTIINGETYKEIRRNHASGNFLSKCASCDMPRQKDL